MGSGQSNSESVEPRGPEPLRAQFPADPGLSCVGLHAAELRAALLAARCPAEGGGGQGTSGAVSWGNLRTLAAMGAALGEPGDVDWDAWAASLADEPGDTAA